MVKTVDRPGDITSSLQTFAIRNGGSFRRQISLGRWQGWVLWIGSPSRINRRTCSVKQGEEPAPVLEVPEFTGGVNAVEALVWTSRVHRPSRSDSRWSSCSNSRETWVQGWCQCSGMALVHELPEYRRSSTVGDQAAPTAEKTWSSMAVSRCYGTGTWAQNTQVHIDSRHHSSNSRKTWV